MIVKPRTFIASIALGLTLSATTGYVFYQQAKPQAPRGCSMRAPALPVSNLEFGMLAPNENGKMVFIPTDTIARRVGYGYGWRAKLVDNKTTARVNEQLILPSAPAHWGVTASTALSADRRIATTNTVARAGQDGYITNMWYFSKGDPKGEYTIRVKVDGRHIKTKAITVK